MNKTLVAALMVSVGLGGQAFAENVKEGVMTFSLTRQYELSTNFTSTKVSWKTASAKISTSTMLSAIGVVIKHSFSSKAQIVTEAANFSGFWHPTATVALPTGFNIETVDPTPGLWQPEAQIFVKDGTYCTNVTPFFKIKIQECYDCFYLNSYITDATFQQAVHQGPPCCSPSFTASGNGTDKYYMTLSFDNTINNGALNQLSTDGVTVVGLSPVEDGITPDQIPDFKNSDPYVTRFTLNGIVTYKWSFKNLNSTDSEPTFIGSASYPAYGYGFVAKTCCMVTGTLTIAEKAVSPSACCLLYLPPILGTPVDRVDWNQDPAITKPEGK